MAARPHDFSIRRRIPHHVVVTNLESGRVYPLPGFQLAPVIAGTVFESSPLFRPPVICNLRYFDQLLADSSHYLSPEVIRDRVPLTSYPVYACGVIIFELLTGCPIADSERSGSSPADLPTPSTGSVTSSAIQKARSISSASLDLASTKPLPHSALFDVSNKKALQRLENCLVKCLEIEPRDRYINLDALLHDLSQIIQSCNTRQWTDWDVGVASDMGTFKFPTEPVCRDHQISILNSAMSKVEESPDPQSINVWGVSGTGKTFLLTHWTKTLMVSGRNCVYGSAKLDEETHSPIASFHQVFDTLLLSILRDPNGNADKWRQRISNVVGTSLPVFLSMLPRSTCQLVTSDPPPLETVHWPSFLSSFKRWCKGFLHLFATPDRPLVIVIDDAQRMSSEELDIWRSIFDGGQPLKHSIIITSFRTTLNQPSPIDKQVSVRTRQVEATNLLPAGVQAIVAACVRAPFERLSILSELLFTETRGNPLFLLTILQNLVGQKNPSRRSKTHRLG